MRTYTIMPSAGTPDWNNIPALNVDNYQWLPKLPITMQAQLAYSSRGLHVHLRCTEQHIRAEYSKPLSQVCEDSCMEFFFCPVEGDTRYFNMEFNPNGCSYIGFGAGRQDHLRLVLPGEDAFLEKTVRYTPDGWEIYFTVPLSFLRLFFPDFDFAPGRKLRANCYKCADKSVQPHYLAWNPIAKDTPDFHRPEDFGVMMLG